MESYTKAEVDAKVSDLLARVASANGKLEVTSSAVAVHNASTDAHHAIISTKADTASVAELRNRLEKLRERLNVMEQKKSSRLTGTLQYNIIAKVGEQIDSIKFDITPISDDETVTYEVYGESSKLIRGLAFNADTGTISGMPEVMGKATFVVLAKSGSYGVFITIKQDISASE